MLFTVGTRGNAVPSRFLPRLRLVYFKWILYGYATRDVKMRSGTYFPKKELDISHQFIIIIMIHMRHCKNSLQHSLITIQ